MLLSHGFVMDGEGKKMSKSLGNVIVPDKIVKQMGADIARLWVSSVDYLADVRISNEILKQTSDVYRKIRNTFRFLLGNVNDFNPATDSVSYDEMLEIDQYMHNRLNQFIGKTLSHYEAYDYLDIYQDIQNFINVDLSNFYLDYGKDILYIEKADSLKRRSMQTVLYETLVKLTKLLAPIIPHTADEIWGHIPHVEEESVHLTDMPEPHEIDTVLMEKWSQFMKLRDDVNRALEVARNEKVIGKSLEAHITLSNSSEFDTVDFLSKFNDLNQLFIVSKVDVVDELTEGTEYELVKVKVDHAEGEKCQRCWNYSDQLGSVNGLDHLCPRCQSVVATLG